MKKNIGSWDKAARLVIGAVLLLLVYTGQARWWGLVGLVLLVTGALSFCPLYALLGIGRRR
jgi:hypothetical protein